MSIPDIQPDVPELVTELAAGRPVVAVWVNGIGGVTWQIGSDAAREFVKLGPAHVEFEPADEAERLAWVARWMPVPEVLGVGYTPELRWLHTRGLPGHNAISDAFRSHPVETVTELGRALRHWHDSVPVRECQFDWSAESRLSLLSPETRAGLGAPPKLDEVVCHGDACNPNFLLDDSGGCVGYVDLGRLGVGDRWADLAPALMSLGWNYGEGYEAAFLDGYGIEPDAGKRDWYAALWDADPGL